MGDLRMGFSGGPADKTYSSTVAAPPTPPTIPQTAASVAAPALGLGLETIIIVNGNADVTVSFHNVNVRRR